ncbi:MAG: hypothetical protein V4472_23445 [Pseudomonadota bacterium]
MRWTVTEQWSEAWPAAAWGDLRDVAEIAGGALVGHLEGDHIGIGRIGDAAHLDIARDLARMASGPVPFGEKFEVPARDPETLFRDGALVQSASRA